MQAATSNAPTDRIDERVYRDRFMVRFSSDTIVHKSERFLPGGHQAIHEVGPASDFATGFVDIAQAPPDAQPDITRAKILSPVTGTALSLVESHSSEHGPNWVCR